MIDQFPFAVELHRTHVRRLPAEGDHIIASYDDDSIVVYATATDAVAESKDLSGLARGRDGVVWIRPGFLLGDA